MGNGGRCAPFRLIAAPDNPQDLGGLVTAEAKRQLRTLDERIAQWLKDDSDKAQVDDWDDSDAANLLVEPDRSWQSFALCSALNWRHLPEPGGLDDQPDYWWHDMTLISRRVTILRGRESRNKKRREDAQRRLGLLSKIRRGHGT